MTETSSRSSNPLPFVLPFVVFTLISLWQVDVMGSFEGDGFENSPIPTMTPEVWNYIAKLGMQIVVCGGLVFYFRKTYFEHFRLRISPLSVAVGIIGVFLWIGVCYPQLEDQFLGLFPESLVGNLDRPSFNPFMIKNTTALAIFLIARFGILAVIVPLVEELLVRGWLVRWVQNPSWEDVGYKGLTMSALFAASIYGIATHPKEMIAAFLWFGLVTWLMVKTENLWDCVVAHAVTNLLLGIYVLWFSQWHLW